MARVRRVVRDRLKELEDAGVGREAIAAVDQAGAAAVAYVEALDAMGARRELIETAADTAIEFLEEKRQTTRSQ